MNNLLDYFFPIAAIEPTQQASTGFLKQACLVVKPKSGVTPGSITLCTTMAQVAALTDNLEAQQLFNAGMSRVYILVVDDLNIATELVGYEGSFYTLLISSDFTVDDVEVEAATGTVTVSSYANLVSGTADTLSIEGTVFTAQAGAATPGDGTFQAATSNDATAASLAAQINAHAVVKLLVTASVVGAAVLLTANDTGLSGNNIDVVYTDGGANVGIVLSGLSSGKLSGGGGLFPGTFKGVIAYSGTDDTFLKEQNTIPNRVGMHSTSGNKAKNMLYAFGKLLSNALNWTNQQFISMPFADDVDTVGEANVLFDDKTSFVLTDGTYGNRLGLFAAGGKAIVGPYIKRNLEIDMQSAALTYVSGNQPAYNVKQATLLEDSLQKVIDSYITRGWITAGTVEVKLEQDNFVASGYINISEPKALWRIFGEMRQTL